MPKSLIRQRNWLKAQRGSESRMNYPVDVDGLTKRFTVKKTLQEGELGLLNLVRRLVQKRRTKETILAVDGVYFQIEKGELFGLLGPNGAGKTTLTKTLCTLLWPNAGTARINGYDIRKEPGKVRSSIGTVLDVHMGWYGRLSCRQNLLFYAQLYGIPPSRIGKRIREALELVGLTEKTDEWQQKLSSGMQRKLDMARALLPDPPILLLDEPTLQLDPKSAKDLRRTIKEDLCQQQNKTILWTTHNMNEAEEICDKVAIMHKGKMVAIDRPEEVKHLVRTGKNVILDVGRLPQALLESIRGIGGVISISSNDLPGELFHVKVQVKDESIAPSIAQTIVKNGGALYSMKVEEPTLEEALIKLTEGQ